MTFKRWLYLIHRWLGIGMGLLLVMWFFSGVVMMYVEFPSLTIHERLAGLPALDADSLKLSPAGLLAEQGSETRVESLRLTTVTGRPAYVLKTVEGERRTVFADNGEPLDKVSASDALAAADVYRRSNALLSSVAPTVTGPMAMDQWTVSGSLHSHRPLYRVRLNDAAHTHLYVSSKTAEVVRDTRRSERIWNWLGANLHWIYPLQLRRHPALWYWVIVVLSLIGLASIITGGIIGVMRLRLRKRYRGEEITPYRGFMKWHYLLGLVCLVFLTTYMFSGLMSMNPWGVFSPRQSYDGLLQAYQGATNSAGDRADFERVRDYLRETGNVKEVRWQWLDGTPYPVAISAPDKYRALSPARGPDNVNLVRVARQSLEEAIRRFAPGAQLIDQRQLEQYDLYYYSHHQRWRPLPVWRLRFDNPDQSWFYIDGVSGELLDHQTRHDRIQRWLYHGLHSLDFSFLIDHRPLWDIVVILLSVLGLALSITSVVIGWRRLVH